MALRRNFPEGFVEPCIPIRATRPPSGPDWIHEIKHDGYRLIVRRDGDNVRLYTRRGYDWSDRYPAISRAAAKLRARSFTLDGVDYRPLPLRERKERLDRLVDRRLVGIRDGRPH